MKKFCIFAAVCVSVSTLYAQYYEGQGGRGISVGVALPTGRGLSQTETDDLPKRVQKTLVNDLQKVSGMIIGALPEYTGDYTLIGSIEKDNAGRYWIDFSIKNGIGVQRASYGPIRCSLEELRNLTAISGASEALIGQMGVKLTAEGLNALRRRATNEVAAIDNLVKADNAPTEFERIKSIYDAVELDPSLVEAAKRLAKIKEKTADISEITIDVPVIRTTVIKPVEYPTVENRMVATGNIGADARKRQEQYDAQKEVSRVRQESNNRLVRNLESDMRMEFAKLRDTVQQQQKELLEKRDDLLRQQREQIEEQRNIIDQLRDTENSNERFFTEHPPFEIIYNPAAKETGTQDLERGTISLHFFISSIGTPAMQVMPKIFADFQKGLETIGKNFANINTALDQVENLFAEAEAEGRNAQARLVRNYAEQIAKIEASEKDYAAKLADLDAKLGTSGYAALAVTYAVQYDKGYAERLAREYAVRPAGYKAINDKTTGARWSLNTKWDKDTEQVFVIDAELRNESGRVIGTGSVRLTNKIRASAYTEPESASDWCVFPNVPASGITNKMTVAILRVNGRAVNAGANDYIKISALEPDSYTKDGYNIAGYDRSGYNVFGYDIHGYDKNGFDRYGFDREGYDKDGYKRDGYDKDGYDRNGYNIAGYDKEGYNGLGYDRDGYDKKGRNRWGLTRGQVRAKVFARERLDVEIWAGGGGDVSVDRSDDDSVSAGGNGGSSPNILDFKDGAGGFMSGGNFIIWLGRPYFSFITEASYFLGGDEEGFVGKVDVGGGLRLSTQRDSDGPFLLADISVTGGVGFITNTAMPTPYLHIGGSFYFFTGGVFIHFFDSGSIVTWYVGLKLRFGWIWDW